MRAGLDGGEVRLVGVGKRLAAEGLGLVVRAGVGGDAGTEAAAVGEVDDALGRAELFALEREPDSFRSLAALEGPHGAGFRSRVVFRLFREKQRPASLTRSSVVVK